jgi:hypothetical protein
MMSRIVAAPPQVPASALSQALGRIEAVAPFAYAGTLKLGARHFLREPWRLERLHPRIGFDNVPRLIAVLASIAETERGNGRAGHWGFDPNRRLAARQGLVAARYARRFGPPLHGTAGAAA